MVAFVRILSSAALLAVAVWLGGLIALGALAAPVIFSMVPFPSSADAMTVVFRRFDLVAMTCAAVVLGTEAARALQSRRPTRVDRARTVLALVAAAAAVFEGVKVSPRIAALHTGGAIRGLGEGGVELARLHHVAEWCGQIEVVSLVGVVVLFAMAIYDPGPG
jgi:hypothetical protein